MRFGGLLKRIDFIEDLFDFTFLDHFLSVSSSSTFSRANANIAVLSVNFDIKRDLSMSEIRGFAIK
jgi:hypothetical protein